MPDLKEKIKEIILLILNKNEMDLVEMKFSNLGPAWHLKIFIDKLGGVTIHDCAKISTCISDILDTEDIISHKYLLEVSSPGLDRPLETETDFKRKIGEKARVFLKKEMLGKKEIEGKILQLKDEQLIFTGKKVKR